MNDDILGPNCSSCWYSKPKGYDLICENIQSGSFFEKIPEQTCTYYLDSEEYSEDCNGCIHILKMRNGEHRCTNLHSKNFMETIPDSRCKHYENLEFETFNLGGENEKTNT